MKEKLVLAGYLSIVISLVTAIVFKNYDLSWKIALLACLFGFVATVMRIKSEPFDC